MDCARNIITANFSGGTSATTAPLWQWDYGQVLCITGIEDLPAAFEVHFSTNRTGGVSTTAVGADGQVTIPNVLLTIGKNLNAWIYLSDAQGEGETEYSITIPVKSRPMPETYDAEVSGEFDDVVRQVSEYSQTAQTAADNAGASASAAATSASEAAASVSAAETAKNAAETAQGNAEDAQTAAETAAQTATEKAQQTAQDAAQAALDAGRAESAAGSAEAAQTGAENAKADAETAAQGAAASASASSASATSAGQSANAAAQSASAAAQSAASIEGDVQTATQKANEATTAAGQAVTAKDAAVTAQQGAEAAATNAGQSASTATAKASEAATSASNAAQSKTDAEAAAARAEQAAATLTVDTALSDSSINPVQNKVITSELTNVKSHLDEIAMENSIAIDDSTLTTDSYIMTTGSLSPNTSFHVSAMIPVASWMQSVTIKNSGALSGGCAVAFYRTNQFNTVSFISGVSLPNAVTADSPVVTTIPENAAYLAFSARKSVPFSASIDGEYHLKFDDTFESETKPASAKAILNKINESRSGVPQWLWQCDVGKPVIHFSFDDVCRSFIDIINGSYASIWDQSLFSDLKNIHESTGAVFTLNCFNTFTEDQNYSISDLPSTYASELSAAQTWLKFAFHGADDTSNYNTSTGILAAYNTFVSAIYTFTGDYDCIDRITRLGFFGGTLENVLAIKNTVHGIIGLLSADDTRQSYFLDASTNTYLYNKGKYYDQTNDLLFIKSQPRADSNNATAITNGLLSNPTNMKLTEIYIHEQSWDVNYKNRIVDIATWANNHGYVHAYSSLIYSH